MHLLPRDNNGRLLPLGTRHDNLARVVVTIGDGTALLPVNLLTLLTPRLPLAQHLELDSAEELIMDIDLLLLTTRVVALPHPLHLPLVRHSPHAHVPPPRPVMARNLRAIRHAPDYF